MKEEVLTAKNPEGNSFGVLSRDVQGTIPPSGTKRSYRKMVFM